MQRPGAFLAALTVLGHLWAAACGAAEGPPRLPGLAPCKEPGLPPEALCGTYEVFENRAVRTGRKVPLQIVVLPATGPGRLPDPLVYFAGGPGEASIPEGLFVTNQLASLRRKRDVLLVDLRGTGRSGGLFCTELKEMADPQRFLDEFLPADEIHACQDRLKKEADLSWYTTDAAIEDVEEVRAALGYGPLNLIGGSYGTRAVLTYLRLHPRSVRTATMHGVSSAGARYPLGLARAAQDALDGLIAECAGDPACHGAFPKLPQEMDAVLSRAIAEPVRVRLNDPGNGRPLEVRLTRAGLAQTLRYMLYAPAEAALVPLQVHLASQGDWKPLARSAYLHGNEMVSVAEGFYQSVTCAEGVALIREEEIAEAVAGTFLGDFRVRRQKIACEGWPVRDLGPDLQSPVVSDVPSLLISGERDPATPVSEAELAARTLERARHVVIPDGSHSRTGLSNEDCMYGIMAAFIEAGAAEGLDTSCVATMRRPEFELPEVKVARADLARLPGSYASQEMGLEVRVDLQGFRLSMAITQGPPFPPAQLIPTSPTRFRVEGEGMAPGLAVVFQVTGEKATALSILQPGKPEVVMTRSE